MPLPPSPVRKRKRPVRTRSILGGGEPTITRTAHHPPPGAPNIPAGAAPGYDWGNGQGGHSISLAAHNKHVTAARDAKDPLLDPSQQLSGTGLKNAANDLVDLEFGPQRSALQRELENVTTQGTALAQRAGDYSAQTAATDAALPGQVGAIGELLNKALGANADTATAAVKQNTTDAKATDTADMALRGGVGAGIGAQAADSEGQKQLDRLAQLTQEQKGDAAAQTANYQGLAAISGQARAQMGNEVQGQLLNRLASNQADVRGRQGDLAAQEGPARSKALTDLRQTAFENLATQAGLDIKTADLKAQTAEGQAKLEETAKARRQRARDAKATRDLRRQLSDQARTDKSNEPNSIGIKNSDWLKMSNSQRAKALSDYQRQKTLDTTRPSSSKPVAMTQAARDKRTRIDSMLSDVGRDAKLQRHVGEPGPRLTEILTHRGADPLEAQAAAEVAKHGYLTPETQAALERAGVRIPRKWKKASQGAGSGNNPVAHTGA